MDRLIKTFASGKCGFKNSNGDFIIPAIFDDAYQVNNEYIIVLKENNTGVISVTGKVIIDCDYEEIIYLKNNLFAVRKKDKIEKWLFGVINNSGEVLIDFNYKFIKSKGGCFIQCYKNADYRRNAYDNKLNYLGGLFNYFNENHEDWYNLEGSKIFDGEVIEQRDNYIVIKIDQRIGLIDKNGNQVLEAIYEEIRSFESNLFIVRLKNDINDWVFGVVDDEGNTIINFNFKLINGFNGRFFQCFKNATSSECDDYTSYNNRYCYNQQYDELWTNNKGLIIHTGEAKVLSNELLAINKLGKWGVVSLEGKQVVNFFYDEIKSINEYVVILKDGKVGILDNNGNLVIDPSYLKIECVNIPNENDETVFYGHTNRYTPEINFDTNIYPDKLDRSYISGGSSIIIENSEKFNLDNYLILLNDKYSELYSKKEGILYNSRYDDIRQLTNLSYVVKMQGKYGVFRSDVKELIINCEYDRIIWEGGHLVFICKEDLWGAYSLVLKSEILYDYYNVEIPPKFIEIKILDQAQLLFGVKTVLQNQDKENEEGYTLLSRDGTKIHIEHYPKFDSQFIFYSISRILTSFQGKYGFINLNGYTSIPFKYDEIIQRKDGDFDVRIGQEWGILTLNGFEKVAIRYTERLPEDYRNIIVRDFKSNCYGVLSETGSEKIPSVFEHLMQLGKYYCFGFGGYLSGDQNFFSYSYICKKWGLINEYGNVLIDSKYDCYKIDSVFILAGRDGRMLYEGQMGNYSYGREYSGDYDLYNQNGDLLIGGFKLFKCYLNQKVFVFHFGGRWVKNIEDVEFGGYDIEYETGFGRWLVTNFDLRSLINRSNNELFSIKKGYVVTFKDACKLERSFKDWNIPKEILLNEEPKVEGNAIIISYNQKKRAIRITDNTYSDLYDQITFIAVDLFFVAKQSKVGISNIFSNSINNLACNYLALTFPVDQFVFGIKEIDSENSCVELFDIRDISTKPIIAISSINTINAIHYIFNGGFLMSNSNKNKGSLCFIRMPYHHLFDEDFLKMISKDQSINNFMIGKQLYWFSSDKRLEKSNKY